MNRLNLTLFEESQQAKLPTDKISTETKKQYKNLLKTKKLEHYRLQNLAKFMCRDFGVPETPVRYSGQEPHKTKNGRMVCKTHGHYTPRTKVIKLYKYTAKRKKIRATKSTISTLIHELCHHFDLVLLNLPKSPHTSGFYKRISQLETELKT